MFLIAFFATLAARQMFWAVSIPIFNSPDEIIHLQMIACLDRYGLSFYQHKTDNCLRSLVRAHNLNWFSSTSIIAREELQLDYAPKGRHALREAAIHITDLTLSREMEIPEDHLGIPGSASYTPLYYYLIAKTVRLLRLIFSIDLAQYVYLCHISSIFMFYLPAMALCYRLALSLFSDSRFATLALVLIANHPYLTFFGSVTSNDLGVLLLSLVCIHSAVRCIKGEPRAAMGLFAASLLLISTKQSGGLVVMSCSVSAAALVLLSRSPGRIGRTAYILLSLTISLIVLFFVYPRFLGPLVVQAPPRAVSLKEFLGLTYALLLRWGPESEFVGGFGWYEVRFPQWIVYSGSAGAAALYMFSVVWAANRLFADYRNHRPLGRRAAVFALAISPLMVTIALLGAQYAKMATWGWVASFRFVLVIFPAVLMSIALYLYQRGAQRTWPRLVLAIFSSFWLSANVLGIALVWKRFYWARGLGVIELVNRFMQYKPIWVKSWVSIIALVGMYVALIVLSMVALAKIIGAQPAGEPILQRKPSAS